MHPKAARLQLQLAMERDICTKYWLFSLLSNSRWRDDSGEWPTTPPLSPWLAEALQSAHQLSDLVQFQAKGDQSFVTLELSHFEPTMVPFWV